MTTPTLAVMIAMMISLAVPMKISNGLRVTLAMAPLPRDGGCT